MNKNAIFLVFFESLLKKQSSLLEVFCYVLIWCVQDRQYHVFIFLIVSLNFDAILQMEILAESYLRM
jgi:hypothetical protein